VRRKAVKFPACIVLQILNLIEKCELELGRGP